MLIEFAAKTDKGLVRTTNQDCFYASGGTKPLFVVCDGMGGHASGDIASRSAVNSAVKYIEMHTPYDFDGAKAEALLKGACKYANSIVLTRSKTSPEYRGMGTTCDICFIAFDTLYLSHVGDSRVYLYRNDKLKLLTHDHTVVDELLLNGTITEEEAKNHPNRHMITRAVGTEADIECDFLSERRRDGDKILMCTDGLTNTVPESGIIRAVITGRSAAETVDILINKANENGGTDNITAVMINYAKDEGDKQ